MGRYRLRRFRVDRLRGHCRSHRLRDCDGPVMTDKPSLLLFEILYYNGGPEHAPNRVIGREFVHRRDLTAAIVTACNRMRRPVDMAKGAHGFYVQVVRAGTHSAYIYQARTGRTLEA